MILVSFVVFVWCAIGFCDLFIYKNLRILGENCVRHLMYIVCTYDIICMLDVLTMYVLMLMCKYSSFEYL